MAINSYQPDEISLLSIRGDLKHYSWKTLKQDASAGLSVAFLTVPQAMAYALVAGMPLSCGIFAAIFSAIIATVFGSSRHLVVGPSNAIALLVQAATTEVMYAYYRNVTGPEWDIMAVMIMTQLTVLVGAFQLVAAVCKLGRLTHFVSHSVIIGYIVGAALAVMITQLSTFLGLPSMQGVYSLYQRAAYIVTHLNLIYWPTAILGICSIIMLVTLKRTWKKLPAAVIVLIVAGIAVHLLGISSYTETELFDPYEDEAIQRVTLIGDAGEVHGILPHLSLPYFDPGIMNHLLPFAFAVALLSILETTSVAKTIATNSGQHLSINQEIFGLGLANFFASFISALPSSGSPSRSPILFDSGGKTRFAGIFNAFFSLLIVFVFGFFVTRIPLAALAAILLVNAVSIVNPKQFLLCLKATRSDAFVLITTLLSCLFFSLHIAFYIGIVLSITLYLKKASMPLLIECTFDDNGKLGNIDFAKKREKSKIRMINVQGELFFGAADLFQTTLKALAEDDNVTKVIILRLKNARDIDATACLALQQLYEYLASSNRHLILCGLTDQSWEVLCDSGLVEQIGKENLVTFNEQNPNLTVQKALNRAKVLIGSTEEVDDAQGAQLIPSKLENQHLDKQQGYELPLKI